ncbi:hypothetical protein JX265_008824 [Neoarthrinium moseri]|uniref:protein-L-isoaspartate(D-aspartate) O-methyltransferase n=1 Tax=Neoarthrinium moseri TaxID=1658444 RepID=A0A9P9WHB3_9PEZI|nr:uncharacterized protein JN550_009541 [Neoarthrinium moseri]KAI1848394.1 hypothetical protein JX266_005700 [Neoarthrinium moseri]KAI1863430.1 hypothetical protein JN550_009541 [Neoarthrinium moseri]KAI1863607.1 hypothetical protein JX265_008824 [Neoarthrinium moseri]
MAWRSSGSSNAALVENMWDHGLLTSPIVKAAFLKVDRAHYAPSAPYQDSPQSIGHGATISAPHMHANAVESLLEYVLPAVAVAGTGDASAIKDGEGREVAPGRKDSKIDDEVAGLDVEGVRGRPRRVLDIGSGSGYLTHVMAELAGEGSVVVGIEHIDELRDLGEANMAKSPEGRALLESGRVRFRVGDGRKGWSEPSPGDALPGVGGKATSGSRDEGEEGGWDAIHVGAAALELHQELVDQLRSPGRMFIPVGGKDGWDQFIWTVDKDRKGKVTKKKLYGVRYVPLTDAPARRRS